MFYPLKLSVYSIHFMNQGTQASQNLIKGRIWPAGWTLDMPDLSNMRSNFKNKKTVLNSILFFAKAHHIFLADLKRTKITLCGVPPIIKINLLVKFWVR